MAYGTLTNSAINKIRIGARSIWEVILDWKVEASGSAGAGTVNLNVATILLGNHPKIFLKDYFGGFLIAGQTIPGHEGDIATNVATLTNITIHDSYGCDVMAGVLSSRSSSAAEIVYADPPILLNSELELNISTTKTEGAQGRLILWIEQ
jgi:hypothetical protein